MGRNSVRWMTVMTALTVCAWVLAPWRTAWADPPSYLATGLVTEAARRAVVRAGLGDDVTRSMATRARAAAWLPTVTASASRVEGGSLTQTTTVLADRLLLNDSMVYTVRVSLALDRLVFDPREAAIARTEVIRGERRMALEALVVDLLGQMEQARLARTVAGQGGTLDATVALTAARARARLELLTGMAMEALVRAAGP